ncbi:MAG: HEAT repeat domain-containing protein [Sandaracinaceae bacterium]|nr:HEAT repeat domain-containing protein [Sandaracinaceae bacterium]
MMLLVALAPLLLSATPLDAQRARPRRGRPAATAAPSITDETRGKLASSDPAQLEEALMELVVVGTPEVSDLIAERLRRGLPRASVVHVVETLGVLGHRNAGPALIEVALVHRHADVRAAAVRAVQSCRPPDAAVAVRARLSDPAASVRAAAAVALGGLGDHDAVEALFQVLDRNLYEAAPSLASLVRESEIGQLTAYVGRLPFDVMSPALTELLARDDISERRKLDLIAQLQELGTSEVKVFLEDLADSIPAQGRDARVRQAAMDAAMRIVD